MFIYLIKYSWNRSNVMKRPSRMWFIPCAIRGWSRISPRKVGSHYWVNVGESPFYIRTWLSGVIIASDPKYN